MQAPRRDAAEVGADVAAVRDAGAVAEQQPADESGDQRTGRDSPHRRETAGEQRGQQRAEDDAEVHHRRDVCQHTGFERGACAGADQ